MHAATTTPARDASRALSASALAGIAAFLLVLGFGIVGPQLVAGTRVSGTEDAALVRAYYAHPPLAVLQAALFPAALAILVLAVGLHAIASRDGPAMLANVALAFTIAIVPGYLLSAALQAALVSAASTGADVLPLFRLWDVFYNSALYALEAGYVIAFSFALTQARAFPRWFRVFGLVVGLLQAVNMSALWVGIPDAATTPGNVGMLAWLLTASLLLLRVARRERRPARA